MLKPARKIILGLIIAAFLVIVILFSPLLKTDDQTLHKKDFLVFGTRVNVQIRLPNKQSAEIIFDQLQTQYKLLHRDWHSWEVGGLIEKVNRAILKQQPININEALIDLIEAAKYYETKTDGLFNPAIGQLVALWGFHRQTINPIKPPKNSHIQQIIQSKPSMHQLRIKNKQLSSTNPKVKIDIGAIAKGYIADWTASFLNQQGIENVIINIGGDITAKGRKGKTKWKVAIQHPNNPKKIIGIVQMKKSESIATSGNYTRFYHQNGRRISHIINPKNGQPVEHTKSVTVLAKTGAEADVMATALLVGGPKQFMALVKKFDVKYALLFDQYDQLQITPALQARLLSSN